MLIRLEYCEILRFCYETKTDWANFLSFQEHNRINYEEIKVDPSFRKINKHSVGFHVWKVDVSNFFSVNQCFSTFFSDLTLIHKKKHIPFLQISRALSWKICWICPLKLGSLFPENISKALRNNIKGFFLRIFGCSS